MRPTLDVSERMHFQWELHACCVELRVAYRLWYPQLLGHFLGTSMFLHLSSEITYLEYSILFALSLAWTRTGVRSQSSEKIQALPSLP